ncbi:helix-turn-helix domain-containing protein [Streptomyces sp. NPDC057702]|uniref:helix-turn-helix domain-containing protein n=1 Tax=unclassified Streptomyces TaxID=2593676 RepID=UPI00369A7FF2
MTTAIAGSGVGALLRSWRSRRRVSQLELASRADSSARHISFIETGRSRPSQEMVLRLADHLDIPVRERNALLVAAGYAPHYPESSLDDPSLSGLREGLERLLTAYEPYPALVMNARYEVVAANAGTAMLLAGLPEHLTRAPVNAMRVTMHPEGIARRILNYRQWREHLLEQMERQLALLRSEPLRVLYEEVSAYPLPAERDQLATPEEVHAPFALPMVIEHEGRALSFISTVTTFNTPMDVTVSELAVETFLPADSETARFLHQTWP